MRTAGDTPSTPTCGMHGAHPQQFSAASLGWSLRIVLVLYKTDLSASTAYRSLVDALAETGLQLRVNLLLCDNSPLPQQAEAVRTLGGAYCHQPSNPGLAASYNLALQRAVAAHEPWVMLLDQDTVVTAEYLQQVFGLAEHYRDQQDVVALVPKLVQHGHLHSPHSTVAAESTATFSGLASGTLRAFNSGAVLRTSALLAIGGFPRQFWLDFLDHATFHLLQQHGRVLVMPVALQHELFTNTAVKAWDKTYLARHRNLLQAEAMFYRMYGTPQQKWQYRRRLLRHALGSLAHLHLPVVRQLLWTMLGDR